MLYVDRNGRYPIAKTTGIKHRYAARMFTLMYYDGNFSTNTEFHGMSVLISRDNHPSAVIYTWSDRIQYIQEMTDYLRGYGFTVCRNAVHAQLRDF